MRISLFICVLFISCTICATKADEATQILEDFDGPQKLSRSWTALGDIRVEQAEAPNATIPGVHGQLVICDAKPNSKFVVNREFARPNYSHFEAIRFRVRALDASKENPKVIEFQVFSEDRPVRFWRKVEIATDQWQLMELPMCFFRHSSGASVQWDEVSRFGFHFRDAAAVSIDGIELFSRQEHPSPYLSPQRLSEIAIGDDALISSSNHFVVITNDRRVDAAAVLKEFQTLLDMIYQDFPGLRKPTRPIPMLIFSTKQQYQEFWPRFAAKFASQVGPIRSNGYSLLGVAGSYYSDEFGAVRPVFVHEACHAILAPAIGLSNGSEWLHEGLANYYQLNWTKQNIHELTSKMIVEGKHQPLRELLNGEKISMRDYPQVTLVTSWLMVDAVRRKQFQTAIELMSKHASTDLETGLRTGV